MFRAAASDIRRIHISLLLCLAVSLAPAAAQTQSAQATTPGTAQDKDEVIRISAEIVQTDVMVFDKSGKFVDGLRPEEFELRVDGRAQRIDFFELVRAGSADEDLQLRAARGGGGPARAPSGSGAASVLPLDRNRTIFFFIDDLHLAPENLPRVRATLKRFVDDEMAQNDEAAISSTTGQLGFLQQLTGEKAVLRAAVERLSNRSPAANLDLERPAMTEAHAIAIDRNQPGVLDWFVQMAVSETPALSPDVARHMVQQRARNIVAFTNNVATQTLSSLEGLTRRAAALPGRKLLFFVSEGFYIDQQNSDTQRRLRRITDAAARAGVVIYAVDARGLSTGLADASAPAHFDPRGLQVGVDLGRLSSTQEPLRTLSADTGGRALLNTNALGPAVSKAISETSVYYLLAWKPEGGDGRAEKFRQIQVSVRGRPDLQVLTRRGFFPNQPPASEPGAKKNAKIKKGADAGTGERAKSPDADLFAALVAPHPRTSLPVSLTLAYFRAPGDSMVLTAFVEFDVDFLTYEGEGQARQAVADVVGAVYDANGKVIGTTKDELALRPLAGHQRPVQSYQYAIPPGLHQVRFAARDRRSGRVGSVWQWVEIPDPRKKGFFLSSLFIGERLIDAGAKTGDDQSQPAIVLSADRRFPRASRMSFATFIYNAAHAQAAPPDVVLQLQFFRDGQPVLTTPLRKVQTDGVQDLARIPYAAEVPLDSLPAGKYAIHITAIDRTAKATASQRSSFTIE